MNRRILAPFAAILLRQQLPMPTDAQVVVTPEETDEILANPGMGWETFHRTSKQDKSLPSWIPSTVHYARWGWGELEPQPGKLNTEFLGQGAEGNPRLGPEVGVPGHVLLDLQGPSLPSEMAQGGRRQGIDGRLRGPRPVPDPRHGRSRRLERPSRLHQAAGRSGTTAIPTSTTSTSAPSAGGANGT